MAGYGENDTPVEFVGYGKNDKPVDVAGVEPAKRTIASNIKDFGVTALKSAVGLPQAVVGIADIATGGRTGKALEGIGYKPAETQKILDTWYSKPQQEANKYVADAEGFTDTLSRAIARPSVIGKTVIESAPQMIGGAGIARGLMKAGTAVGTKVAPYLAGAVGEGVMGAGSAASAVREETDDGLLTGKQSLSAAGSGLGTAAFGALGGKLAQKFNFGDIDTILTQGGPDAVAAGAAKKGFIRQVAEAGVSEAAFEEMPQSIQEQMWQNYALGKPLTEGVGNAAAMGLLAGAVMGGVGGGYNAAMSRPAATPASAPLPAPTTDDINTDTGELYTPDEISVFMAQQAANQARMQRDLEIERTMADHEEQTRPRAVVETPGPHAVVETPGPHGIIETPGPHAVIETPGPRGIVETAKTQLGSGTIGRAASAGIDSGAIAPEQVLGMPAADMAGLAPEQQAAVDYIAAIDTGGIPLNVLKTNTIARNLGLEVNAQSRPEETNQRIREAVSRVQGADNVAGNQGTEVPAMAVPGIEGAGDQLPGSGVAAQDGDAGRAVGASGPAGIAVPGSATAGLAGPVGVADQNVTGSADIAGAKIDKKWTAFDPASGTLGVNRAEMPQIKAEHRGAMVNFLNARGITSEHADMLATDLKPTQLEFSPAKVEQAKAFTGNNRSILVSADGHVLDGHHQWLAKREAGEPVKVIRLNAPIRELLTAAAEFPSSHTAAGATPAAQPAAAPVQATQPAQEAADAAPHAVIARVGSTPNSAEPVTVRAGVVHIGEYPAQDAETAEDITVPDGATFEQVADALRKGRALSTKQRIYAGAKGMRQAPKSVSQLETDEAQNASTDAASVSPEKTAADNKPARPKQSKLTPLTDPRLADPAFQSSLPRYAEGAGWAEEGGKLLRDANGDSAGRTSWVPKADWWQGKPLGVTEKLVKAGVAKAVAGENMPMTEKNAVMWLLDVIEQDLATQVAEIEADLPAAAETLAEVIASETSLQGMTFDDEAVMPDFKANMNEADAMRALGFTEDEINETTGQHREAAEGADAGRPQEGADTGAAEEATGGDPAQEGGNAEAFALNQQTPAQAKAKAEAEQKAAAKAEREASKPTGPDVTADQVDMFNTQDALFASNRDEPVQQPAPFTKPEQPVEANKAQAKPETKQEAAKQGKGVENFGEALPPARRAMAAKLDESLTDGDIAARPLSEIWPQAENEAIEDTFAAAVAFAARAEIPAKPRVGYKVKQWVAKVQGLRELAAKIVSGRVSRDEFINASGAYSLRDWIGKVKLLEQLPREQWKRVETVEERPDSYTYDKDGAQVPTPTLRLVIDGKPHYLRNDGTVDGNMDGITALLADAAPEKRMEFEIRRPRSGGKYFINKKGDGQYRRLMEFDTAEEARSAIGTQYDALVGEWENVKARDNITERDLRTAENRPRVGKDHRGGRDVTPEEFQTAFSFRGGEFGKWVQQGKGDKNRQAILNSAFDALHDLADIVGVPPAAISLNGTLGIAFGSRGSGWASAHFEPSNLVINLTKTRGAGALAHEWFHALDNYFSRLRGGEVAMSVAGSQKAYRDNNYITHKPEPLMVRNDGKPYERLTLGKLKAMHEARKHQTDAYNPDHWQRDPKHREGVRPEVEQRFAALVEALNESPMTKRARLLDGKKSGDGYWSSTLERAARTFENYVQARMLEDGYNNDFLANVKAASDTGKNDARYPYLLPGEIKPISEAFDALFGEIQTKETDTGTAMFKRAEGNGLTEADSIKRVVRVQAVVDRIKSGWKNAPEIVVVSDMRDAKVPQRVRDLDAEMKSGGAEGEPRGFISAGKVYIVAGQNKSVEDVMTTLAHETLGHAGLRGLYGDALKPILRQIVAIRRAEVNAKVKEYGFDPESEIDLLRAAEEVLANMAETRPEMGFVKRAIAAIRQWLRDNGLNLKLTDADIISSFIIPARSYIENGAKPVGVGQSLQAAFSLADKTIPSDELKAIVLEKSYGGKGINPAPDGSKYLAAVQRKSNRGIFVVNGTLNRDVFKVIMAEANAAGLDTKKLYVFADLATYQGPSLDVMKLEDLPGGRPMATAQGTNADTMFSRTSIIGDAGRTYTPEQKAAMERTGSVITHKTPQQVAKSLWQDAGKKLAQGIVDQFRPVRDIDAHAYTLLRLAKGATGAFEAFMHHGKLKLNNGAYDADTSGGVLESVFYPIGKETTDFLRWVAGNRAERLMGVGKENLFSPQDIAAFKTLADGTTDFDYTLASGKVTRDRQLIYRDTLAKFNAFNKNVLDMAEQSGLIDGASRKLWENEFYVPFYRVADEDDGGVRGMSIKSGVVRQQAFQKLKGGEQQLNDLLENTLMNWAHLIDASAKNRAAAATLIAAEKLGAARLAAPGEKKTVWFMDGGKKAEYAVEDPYLLEAINGMEYAGLRGPAMGAMSTMKHVLTVSVTASPFFKVRNLIRDSVQAIATADLSYNPLGNVASGGKSTKAGQALANFGKATVNLATLGKADLKMRNDVTSEYVSALAGGGLIRFGTMLEGSAAKRTRQLIKQGAKDAHILDSDGKVRAFYDKVLEPAIASYNELGNRGEEVNRMALYNRLIAQGQDHATASLMARDLMDFSMQGTWTSVRFLTQIVPFMNARLQGIYKLGRASQEDKARFAVVVGGVAMASLALLAAYGGDDDWKQREDWDRDNYWWFKVGGIAYRIPKPFEIGAIGTLAERSAELVFDTEMTGKRYAGASLKLVFDQLAMNPVPQLFKPVIDLYANRDSFTGRDIESMGMERLAPDYRYKQSTSMVARGVSTAGNAVTGDNFLSPVQVDHVVRAYFGWLGAFVVGGADMMIRAASDEPAKPATDYWKTATGGMASKLDGAHSRYVSQMYDQARELEQAYGTWRNLLKTGKVEEAAAYRDDNADKLGRYKLVNAVKGASSKINERIREIERSDMDRTAKRASINDLRKRQSDIAKRLVN